MKRRATVWKSRLYGTWFVTVYGGRTPATSIHPTYAAALAHALAEVGLATPEQHREAP